MKFWFPFPSHSHRIIPVPIPIPTNSQSNTAFLFPFSHHLYFHSHPRPLVFQAATIYRLPKAEKYVYCVVNSKQNMTLQQKHPWESHGNGNSHSFPIPMHTSKRNVTRLIKNGDYKFEFDALRRFIT